MNKEIKITTSLTSMGRKKHSDSDLGEIRFGTLRVSPIKVVASTVSEIEDPQQYQEADRAFEHIRAHLLILAKVLETDLGPGWSIMVEDGD